MTLGKLLIPSIRKGNGHRVHIQFLAYVIRLVLEEREVDWEIACGRKFDDLDQLKLHFGHICVNWTIFLDVNAVAWNNLNCLLFFRIPPTVVGASGRSRSNSAPAQTPNASSVIAG